jgi:hypothetical protein
MTIRFRGARYWIAERIVAYQRSDAITDVARHRPPLARPGAHAMRRPLGGIFGQLCGDAARHRAQRVRYQIVCLRENGKLATKLEQLI